VAARADFTNGGFEDGTFTGWTLDGGTWSGQGGSISYHNTGDPGKSAIVTDIWDPLTLNNLKMVYGGNYAARVNNWDDSYHYTVLSQTLTGWDKQTIYFAWAAVLEEPTNQAHPGGSAPKFAIKLVDTTTSTILYDVAFDAYTGGFTWYTGAVNSDGDGVYKYCDWVVANLDTSGLMGDDFNLTVSAYDCSLGGHGGYAYVDQFGGEVPDQNEIPEPCTLLLLSLGIPAMGLKLRKR
jgi:hypothetical protein